MSDDNKRRISGPDLTVAQDTDQQIAYDYMAKVMMQLVNEKRSCQSVVGPAKGLKEQSERTSLVECLEESQEELDEPAVVVVDENNEEVCERLCVVSDVQKRF